MRILHLNKFANVVGGSETYMIRTAERQKERGHVVGIAGSTARGANQGHALAIYEIDIPEYSLLKPAEKPRVALGTLWSTKQARRVENIVQQFRPDLVHVHLYAHQLTSSVIAKLNQLCIPVIHTAHDYKLICPAYVATLDGRDCFKCAKSISSTAVVSRCHKGSLPWSAVAAAESVVTRRTGAVPTEIIAPSRYMHKALSNSWLGTRSNIRTLRNPCDRPIGAAGWKGNGDYLLYVGRLSPEKGLQRLIETAHDLDRRLIIAGDGPEATNLRYLATRLGSQTEFAGWLNECELDKLRASCVAQVIPSSWPENAPLAAIEAAVLGVPLVVSNRGGLPEYQELGFKVVVVNDWNAGSLMSALEKLTSMKLPSDEVTRSLSWDQHLDDLELIYDEVLRTTIQHENQQGQDTAGPSSD